MTDPISRRILAEQHGKRIAKETIARIERDLDRQNVRGTWRSIEPPRCDICDRIARWRHPDGGQRCNACPRTP